VLRYILPLINTSQLTAELRAETVSIFHVNSLLLLFDCNQNSNVWYVLVGLVQLICMTNIVLSYYLHYFIVEAWKNYGKNGKRSCRGKEENAYIIFNKIFVW